MAWKGKRRLVVREERGAEACSVLCELFFFVHFFAKKEMCFGSPAHSICVAGGKVMFFAVW